MKTYYFTQPFVTVKFAENPVGKVKFITLMAQDEGNDIRIILPFSAENGLPLLEILTKQFRSWVDKGIIPKIPDKYQQKEEDKRQNYIG